MAMRSSMYVLVLACLVKGEQLLDASTSSSFSHELHVALTGGRSVDSGVAVADELATAVEIRNKRAQSAGIMEKTVADKPRSAEMQIAAEEPPPPETTDLQFDEETAHAQAPPEMDCTGLPAPAEGGGKYLFCAETNQPGAWSAQACTAMPGSTRVTKNRKSGICY